MSSFIATDIMIEINNEGITTCSASTNNILITYLTRAVRNVSLKF